MMMKERQSLFSCFPISLFSCVFVNKLCSHNIYRYHHYRNMEKSTDKNRNEDRNRKSDNPSAVEVTTSSYFEVSQSFVVRQTVDSGSYQFSSRRTVDTFVVLLYDPTSANNNKQQTITFKIFFLFSLCKYEFVENSS